MSTAGTVAASTEADETVDAFHRGAFHLVQPARRGHRAGMDAMMLAAAVPSGFSGRLADLGAGAGAAGLAVAARCRNAQVSLIEVSAEMASFARRSLALEANRELAERCEVIEADVTLRGAARREAGLVENAYDFAILNPPFNLSRDRASPDMLRQTAHVMDDEMFEGWLRTASALVRPRGFVALICRPQSLPQALAAMHSRFGGAMIKPLHARPDAPAIRIVIRAQQGTNADLALLPPLILHGASDDRPTGTADAVINGRTTLFGD
jgi:tRNA1(Val) A37 N6-methylase TrmN6